MTQKQSTNPIQPKQPGNEGRDQKNRDQKNRDRQVETNQNPAGTPDGSPVRQDGDGVGAGAGSAGTTRY